MSEPTPEPLWKRVSLELARFKPFDGESYDGFAQRLIAMIRERPSDEAVVERVARAIAHARSWQTSSLTIGDWDDRDDDERNPFLDLARAAIAAMPEQSK